MSIRLTFTLLFAVLLTAPAAAQQPEGWEKVGGPTLTRDVVEQGAYVRLRAQGSRDTLWVWVEHVGKTGTLDLKSARQADAVLVCWPQRFDVTPLSDHMTARIGLIEVPERGRLWVIPEGSRAWEELYEPSGVRTFLY